MEILKKCKNSVKNSFKSILLNYKEFLGIYAAVIIVQLLVGVWALSSFTNYYANDSVFDNNYKYDVIISGDKQTVANLGNRIRHDMSQPGSIVEEMGYSSSNVGVVIGDGEFDRFYSIRAKIERSDANFIGKARSDSTRIITPYASQRILRASALCASFASCGIYPGSWRKSFISPASVSTNSNFGISIGEE